MSFDRDRLRQRAAAVREVSLASVLIVRGAVRDQRDKSKWQTEQGSLSITGPKFMNWRRGVGGGGAIDLVMHLAEIDYSAAVAWLERHCAVGPVRDDDSSVPASAEPTSATQRAGNELRLPVPNNRLLERVLRYLTCRRHLPVRLLEPLVECGKLYADGRANAVFLLVTGKANRPIGAELRGTGSQVWRGMAPGTRKELGYFWIGAQGSRTIVLCESAIDAISCFAIHPERICISTSGARAKPRWLSRLIERGYLIHCGFDADGPGDAAAREMIALYHAVQRLRPPAHDWNDVLASGR